MAEQIVVAQSGIHAQRCAQLLQVRLHVFGAISFYIIVHQIAGQQDNVHFFALHNIGKLVELARAHQNAGVQIAGHADAQRTLKLFIDADFIMAHHRRVGVIHRISGKPDEKQRRKNAQAARHRLVRHHAAQNKVKHKSGQSGIHGKQQHHHPHRHQAKHSMPQLQQQAGNQRIGNRKHARHQPAAPARADKARQQPLHRAAQAKCKHLHQQERDNQNNNAHNIASI